MDVVEDRGPGPGDGGQPEGTEAVAGGRPRAGRLLELAVAVVQAEEFSKERGHKERMKDEG